MSQIIYISVLIICQLIAILLLILLIRNGLVYKAGIKLIDRTYEYNRYYIDHNIDMRLPNISEIVSYEKMMWDFSCWRINSFIEKYWIKILENKYENKICCIEKYPAHN